MNALEKLFHLLEDPINKILVVLDTSASVPDETLEDYLCTIDDAQSRLDPQGSRLTTITDRALQRLVSKEIVAPDPIKVGARHVYEMISQLGRGGGTHHHLQDFLQTDFVQHLAPTHLILMGDSCGALELSSSKFLNSLASQVKLCFLATADDVPALQMARENMRNACGTHEIVGHHQRQQYLAQREHDEINAATVAPVPAGRSGPRL